MTHKSINTSSMRGFLIKYLFSTARLIGLTRPCHCNFSNLLKYPVTENFAKLQRMNNSQTFVATDYNFVIINWAPSGTVMQPLINCRCT